MTEQYDDAPELDLSCQVCGNSACLTDVSPVRFEHAVDSWGRLHAHSAQERRDWRDAIERMSTIRDDDE